MHYVVHWSCTPQLDRGFHFRNIAQVSQVPLTEVDPRNHRTGMQNIRLSVVLPLSHILIRTATRFLQANTGSIQAVSFLIRIQARDLSVPLAENGISWNIQAPNMALMIPWFLY
jgi:hypothetical protein